MIELPGLARHDRLSLVDRVTPIQRLNRLEAELGDALRGVRLFVKRDDVMGVGGGGNKLRKLEFLLGEALAQGCDTFISVGGIQSNHARLSAAASARAGLACELVLTQMVPRNDDDYQRNGNVLLDGLFGAKIHALARDADPLAFAKDRAAELAAQGRKAYVVGAGGSSPVGCLGYADCAREIAEQEIAQHFAFDRIVVPNGSSGTHAGLVAGFAALGQAPRRVRSFSVLATVEETRATTLDKARATLGLLDPSVSIEAEGIDVADGQRGDGYGIPTPGMVEAVRLMASTEGLLLDPVYSGKAFAGLLADIRAGAFAPAETVLYVMTGGVPGLFAYRSTFEGESA